MFLFQKNVYELWQDFAEPSPTAFEPEAKECTLNAAC